MPKGWGAAFFRRALSCSVVGDVAVTVFWVVGVAFAYAAAVIGLHRIQVSQSRRRAEGFPSLQWLDWDLLLHSLLQNHDGPGPVRLPRQVPGGGPLPRVLCRPVLESDTSKRELLCALFEGLPVSEAQLEQAGCRGEALSWVKTLKAALWVPDRAVELLAADSSATVAHVYLREYLELTCRVNAFNLEWAVFRSKRRLTSAIARFGEQPSLFFVRALASSLLGFNQQAIDDLARAVYFSQQSPFYIEAVLHARFIEKSRAALYHQCVLAQRDAP
jgi:hypothetical protein